MSRGQRSHCLRILNLHFSGNLDPNSAYHDYVLAQVKELCERYSADGFWFDIYQAHRLSYSDSSLSKMSSLGVDMTHDRSVEAFTATSIKNHCEEQDLLSFLPSRG